MSYELGYMEDPIDFVLKYCDLPFVGSPHLYQKEDCNRLAPLQNSGLFLDLGLGKTFLSILIGIYKVLIDDFDRVYVLCPQSLITQWVVTLEKMGLSCAAYRGTPTQRKKIDREVDFLVMSYNIFQIDYAILKRRDIFFIVDEATILCNKRNILWLMLQGGEKTTKKVIEGQLLPKITTREFTKINNGCCLLTATPVNKPEDAYGLIKILTPDAYTNYQQFCRIHVTEVDHFDSPKEYGNFELLNENLLCNATLRYTTDHIDLPPLIYNNVFYDLDPGHLKLYRKLVSEKIMAIGDEVLIDATNASALYNWAQRFIFCPDERLYKKEPAGIELLGDLLVETKKALIFGKYKGTNARVMKKFNTGGCFGLVSPAKQAKYIKDFKEGRLDKLTAHPKSGGVGLDLPMCQHVFLAELPVTPRDLRQSVGRCYRQGQEQTVIATHLIARGTIQESLFRKFLAKDDLMNKVINSPTLLSEEMNTKITKGDLLKELRGEE